MLKDFYIIMKLFRTSDNDYDVVALVMGPDEMGSDSLGLRLRCNKTGQVRGRVVDEESIYWNLMKRYFRPGFHIIQARLSEFIEFSRDAEGSLWTANDLLFEVIDEFGNPIANDQIFAFYSQRSLPTPTRDHIIRVAGNVGIEGFLFTGATWHYRLNLLAKRYRGHDILASDNILDWGAGALHVIFSRTGRATSSAQTSMLLTLNGLMRAWVAKLPSESISTRRCLFPLIISTSFMGLLSLRI